MKKRRRLLCLILSFALFLLPFAENNAVYGSETTESTDSSSTDSSEDSADTDSPADISSATVTLSKTTYKYNGEERKPSSTVVLDGTTLKKIRITPSPIVIISPSARPR